MNYNKKRLISIATKIRTNVPLTPAEADEVMSFSLETKEPTLIVWMKHWAVPLSLVLGFSLAAFAQFFDPVVEQLPPWTNLSPSMLAGVDYLWSILSNPIERSNIVYHVPNIALYSFGIVGVKKVLEHLEHTTWLDTVLEAQVTLQEQIRRGDQSWRMAPGHSVLFVGAGDFIGQQLAMTHPSDAVLTISDGKPSYTTVWNQYSAQGVFDDLKNVLCKAGGENAGEYIFFPVKDTSVFLPNDTDFDVSPHKLDILCQNIRLIEKDMGWSEKPILIVGDTFHSSFVQSENQKKVIPKSQDIISLESIAKKHAQVRLLDPTDIVLRNIISIAQGRHIIFRATKEGIAAYKERFYKRLQLLKYKPKLKKTLTIGYDIFEDQTEQQTLAHTVQDYYPVVLSKNVSDALERNGYTKDQYLFVPDLVLQTLAQEAGEQ